MRTLLVGAGAVGQVYGRHLQQGGAEVSFLVKPRYAAGARRGFAMADLNHGGKVERFEGFDVLTDLDQVAARQWDQLWLCISSSALRGDWLGPTIAAAPGAAVVSFQPGLRDAELMHPHVPPERMIKGLIAFSSWHAPLPGAPAAPEHTAVEHTAVEHTAYWSPPLSPSLFEGPGAAEIAATLKRGGLPARVGPALATTARGSAFLLPTIAAMECGGWTFAGLRQAPWAGLAADASSEAMDISCAHLGIGKGPMGAMANACVVRLASRAAPAVAPFDIEKFMEVHFTKVGDQTTLALDSWIAEGDQRGMATGKLQELRRRLLEVRGQASA